MNQIIDQTYRVAIYLRLSKDDGDFSLSGGGKTESNSIHNQRELLMNYLAGHPEMALVEEYKDDGYTGTNFDRPDFQRMMMDIRKGLINCVIVKDLSRFGRDYIDCGKYIEKLFPQLRVRFIAVNDHYDTANQGHSDSLLVPFKNLINDSYSRDISIKVRSNLAVKRQQGECISNFAVYGYRKDPENKNRLLIDDYAAAIVRDIFCWKIDGYSPNGIAERLNRKGVLSPLEYKRSQGLSFETAFKKSPVAEWSHVAVRRILKNEVYTGVMVQGKRTTPNYKTKTQILKDESEWVKIAGTHEAIITRTDFELVQRLMQEDTRAGSTDTAVYPLSGRLFCADCGAPLVRKTVSSKGKKYIYFVCSAYKNDSNSCTQHRVTEELLYGTVLVAIQRQVALLLDMEQALKKVKSVTWEEAELQKIKQSIAMQEQIVERNNSLRLGVYEDLQAGILSKEEYTSLKEEFSARIAAARQAIRQLQSRRSAIQDGLGEQKNWLEQFRQFAEVKELSRKLVVSMIDRVSISNRNEIAVEFCHKDQFQCILEFLEEQKTAAKRKENLTLLPRLEVV